MKKNPYNIVKRQHITEKAKMLEGLKDSEKNKQIRRFKQPKYVFIVDRKANKQEIASAVEEIYKDQNVKVTAVNTINVKGKQRRVRGRPGATSDYKKAVVTFEEGDRLDNV